VAGVTLETATLFQAGDVNPLGHMFSCDELGCEEVMSDDITMMLFVC